MDKIKTLSAAMRYGSKLKPQAFGSLFKHDGITGVLHSCALGAAYDAIESAKGNDVRMTCSAHAADALKAHFGKALEKPLTVPDSSQQICEAINIIPYLNDAMHWSRERIADWLEENGL